MTDTDHDRIDALAREAGSALRRAPSPDVLLRVHRAKRNRQVARATAGGLALVALVAGGIVLTVRDRGDELVPATVPPTPAPETAVPVPITAPDTRVTTLAPAPSSAPLTVPATTPALAAEPDLLYLGPSDLTVEQVQRVVDLDTLEELRTEPIDDAAWRAYSGWREPRTESATGITYERGSYPGDDPADGLLVADRCGRYPLVVEGAPAGASALPERASLVSVSDDGRWVLVIGAATCPVDGLVEPGTDAEQITYDQEARLFDANDPTAPGRLLWTAPYPERQFTSVGWTSDGAWMLVRNLFVNGLGVLVQGVDVIETATGRPLPVDDPTCSIMSFVADERGFVGDGAVAFVERCNEDRAPTFAVAIHALDATQETQPLFVPIEGIDPDAFVLLDVWPRIDGFAVGDATFVVTALESGNVTRTFLGRGTEVQELPVTGQRASFGPLPEIVGD